MLKRREIATIAGRHGSRRPSAGVESSHARKLKAVWPLAAFNSGVLDLCRAQRGRPVADRQTDSDPAVPAIPEFKSISS